MRAKRHALSPFNLSFLDIMFCGFGAVVLLVLILDSDTVRTRHAIHADLRAQLLTVEKRVAAEQQQLSAARESLESTSEALASVTASSTEVASTLGAARSALQLLQLSAEERREQRERLTDQLVRLEDETAKLRTEELEDSSRGSRALQFAGQGDRQYLTGLKLGGKRILILVDASASMLDETLVNVIRRRNMSKARRRAAEKWQRAVTSVEWLLANLPRTSAFQIHVFNTRTQTLAPGPQRKWLDAGDPEILRHVLTELKRIVPEQGTSLFKAFALAARLQPSPDNILLLTDGLPTQGGSRPRANRVSAKQRLNLFDEAVKQLPKGIPVNTLLFPMEGDAYAAAAFWELAVSSRGSFITPSRDWP